MSHLDLPIGHPNRAWSPPDGNESDSTQALLAKLTKKATPEQCRTKKKTRTTDEKKKNATDDDDFGFASATAPPTTQGKSSLQKQNRNTSSSRSRSPASRTPRSTNPTTTAPVPASATTTTTTQANTETELPSMAPHALPAGLPEDSTNPLPAQETPVESVDLQHAELLHEESDNNSEENVAVVLDDRFHDNEDNSNNNTQMMTTRQAAKRKTPPGTTTARQQKKKSRVQSKIKVGGRVYSTRKQIFHLLKDEQKACLRGFPDSYRIYGTVTSGNTNKGYEVSFDIFPADWKKSVVIRKRLTTVNKNEEEQQPNQNEQVATTCATIETIAPNAVPTTGNTARRQDPIKKSTQQFLSLSDDEKKEALAFDCFYGDGPDDRIQWTINRDTEHITKEEDPLEYPDELDIKQMVDFENESFDSIFFKYFFPSVEGHAELMDEFHSDPRSPFYNTVLQRNIKFHQPDNEDPDWIIKQCYLLIVAAVNQSDVGVENLWKRGDSGGMNPYADFGRFIPIHYFKAFQSAASMMFCDKKWWYEDKRDKGWEIFENCLKSYNSKRRGLFHTVLLLLDESMSGWQPKTSKLGGLPNITFEPRKPVPLGTQFKNGAECLTGVMAFQDIVQAPEVQKTKEFFLVNEDSRQVAKSCLPKQPSITAHTAEVLCQVKGAGVREEGWCGGDAWFGSIMTSVELRKNSKSTVRSL